MQLVGILIVLVIFVIGIAEQTKPRVTEISPTPAGQSPLGGASQTEQPTTIPTIIVTLTPPTPTAAPKQQQTDIEKFFYPGASVVSSDANRMHLTSSDSADAITNWYKNKIKESGYNSTAFAATNTNGNILTKLAGANGSTEIRVEITKQSGDVSTQITVTTRTY